MKRILILNIYIIIFFLSKKKCNTKHMMDKTVLFLQVSRTLYSREVIISYIENMTIETALFVIPESSKDFHEDSWNASLEGMTVKRTSLLVTPLFSA